MTNTVKPQSEESLWKLGCLLTSLNRFSLIFLII